MYLYHYFRYLWYLSGIYYLNVAPLEKMIDTQLFENLCSCEPALSSSWDTHKVYSVKCKDDIFVRFFETCLLVTFFIPLFSFFIHRFCQKYRNAVYILQNINIDELYLRTNSLLARQFRNHKSHCYLVNSDVIRNEPQFVISAPAPGGKLISDPAHQHRGLRIRSYSGSRTLSVSWRNISNENSSDFNIFRCWKKCSLHKLQFLIELLYLNQKIVKMNYLFVS
jgi:hypothetical protein